MPEHKQNAQNYRIRERSAFKQLLETLLLTIKMYHKCSTGEHKSVQCH